MQCLRRFCLKQTSLECPRCSLSVKELPRSSPDKAPRFSAPTIDLLRKLAIFVDKTTREYRVQYLQQRHRNFQKRPARTAFHHL